MTKTYFEDLAGMRFKTSANEVRLLEKPVTKETDIIRRAIDLADGWELTMQRDGTERLDNPVCAGFPIIVDDLDQLWLNALSAQLVEQVDELADQPITVVAYPDVTQVYRHGTVKDEMIAYHGGDGRAWNTINAILDSKVLEHG